MICPYLWQGKVITGCEAYPEGLMVPSMIEESGICASSDHKFCPYYIRAEELMAAKEAERRWLRGNKIRKQEHLVKS